MQLQYKRKFYRVDLNFNLILNREIKIIYHGNS